MNLAVEKAFATEHLLTLWQASVNYKTACGYLTAFQDLKMF